MTTITREELEATKKKHLKYFDYAETPIKKWISTYLEKELKDVFDDLNEENCDVILFNHDNKQWCVDFEIENSDHKAMIESKYWEEQQCEKLSNSVKIMLEAVNFTYYPIINTMQNYKKNMQNIVPKFDPETLSFYFNAVCIEKINYDNILNKLNYLRYVKTDNPEMKDEKIDDEIKKYELLINEYDLDKIKKLEKEINELNEKISTKKRLYINIFEIEEIDEELKLKRLPEISEPFHFHDEESLVDQLKKL